VTVGLSWNKNLHREDAIEEATQGFSEFLGKAPSTNSTIIIGANINASIGTKNTDGTPSPDEDSVDNGEAEPQRHRSRCTWTPWESPYANNSLTEWESMIWGQQAPSSNPTRSPVHGGPP
jgi:hypothetical protein